MLGGVDSSNRAKAGAASDATCWKCVFTLEDGCQSRNLQDFSMRHAELCMAHDWISVLSLGRTHSVLIVCLALLKDPTRD
jgi:hypothetical protein